MSIPAVHPGRIQITPYEIVRVALALILLTAAALKGHQLATEPVAETGLLTSRWFTSLALDWRRQSCGLYGESLSSRLVCWSASWWPQSRLLRYEPRRIETAKGRRTARGGSACGRVFAGLTTTVGSTRSHVQMKHATMTSVWHLSGRVYYRMGAAS